VRAVLARALSERRRTGLRRWVEGTWLALGGPAAAADAADLEDAQVFLALLEALEQGGDIADFAELERRMAKLYALPDQAADARLQVMTIHKAKGLEFDEVIVPGLGYRPKRADPQLLLWAERARPGGHEPDLLLAPMRPRGGLTDPIYAYLCALDAAKARHEDTRLLYVAATRAKSRLHWVGHARVREGVAHVQSDTLLEILWPVVSGLFQAEAARVQPDDAVDARVAVGAPPTRLRRLVAGWVSPTDELPAVAAPAQPAAQTLVAPIEFSWASETARHVGTVVHATLQQIAEEGLARWNADAVGARRAWFARDLRALGVPEANLDTALARVERALVGALGDERARWILDAHQEAECELRLSALSEGSVINVALDRTFVDDHGTRWIVDYKTSMHEGGELELFLDREQTRYREQLERYARILRALDGRPVRLALYFPLLRGWREWSVG
jgi:ATP-dependent exoDNAse (exonuclease V) beta subunit